MNALEKAGNRHKYQILLIVFLCFVWAENCFLVLGPSFYYMDPIFECDSEADYVDE